MKRARLKLISDMLVSLAISATACATTLQEREEMDMYNTTLWQLIDTLVDQSSLSPDKIRQVLPIEFLEQDRNVNFSFNESGPLRLVDQVEIRKIDLRFKHKNEIQGLLILEFASTGACVTLDEVFTHYPDVIPSQEAHGLFTYWTTYPPKGKLSFGFKESSRECLASVVINRIDPRPVIRRNAS